MKYLSTAKLPKTQNAFQSFQRTWRGVTPLCACAVSRLDRDSEGRRGDRITPHIAYCPALAI
jgi:hypothetical protein